MEKNSDRKATTKEVKPRRDHEQRSNDPSTTPKTSVNPSTSQKKSASPPADGCLHCGGNHWLRECPTASRDDRRLALEKLRANRNGGKLRSKVARNDQHQGPKTGEVLVTGLVTAPYCADSCSDLRIIPQELVDELVELGSDVDLTRLPQPIVVTVAGGGQIWCLHEVVVHLQLQTAAGMVRDSNVKCLVMSGGETELLLGD
ncbi:hypothetical protein PHMEG_00032560 [Phytophthora megakarya]|uniref:Uncharacterized protein n=1 Tax=Phytophthora megakarya TaxID=4795 RepID=A0A225UV77_9STRA|nr:hypothetical protein PHMEG_00032560 [Phytophthora megakarya]